MATNKHGCISKIFVHQEEIMEEWLREQFAALSARQDLISEFDLRRQSTEFLAVFTRLLHRSA